MHAHSAYQSEKIEKYLKDKECESFIHKKGYRANLFTEQQRKSNTIKSKIRARVEYIFGSITNSMNNACICGVLGKRLNQLSAF